MNKSSKMNYIARLVSGFNFQLIPRGVDLWVEESGKIRTKPVPFIRWCVWKPIFRWDECGKSVTWIIFHAGYVPWWMRKPIGIKHTNNL